MNKIYIKIYADTARYDNVIVDTTSLHHSQRTQRPKTSHRHFNLKLNGVILHCLIQELTRCQQCRCNFINSIQPQTRQDINTDDNDTMTTLRISLQPLSSCPDTIDHNWNAKVNLMVGERCELDHALSWLSTLGGAFSALGDYFANCAETAAKISMHQFQLALRLDDPAIAARCRLYYALSLIQRKQYKLAKSIVASEYEIGKMSTVVDQRLLKMCQGIWAKLRYEWELHRNSIGNNVKKRCHN